MVQLWVSSDSQDGDFMVFLEDVDPTGKSTYITDGRLRASLRAVNTPPYNFLELPWHRGYPEDEKLLIPGQPVKLEIDMMPTSYVFKAGNRIRLAISGSQGRIYDLKKQGNPNAPASVSIYRNKNLVSFVALPVMTKSGGMNHQNGERFQPSRINKE
jgi:putative CocE/NonD family hydrolase